MKVLNLGSLHIDYNYSVNHILAAKETEAADELNIYPGGKGLNQSIAMAKAGLKVYQAGLIGDDGDFLLEKLNEAGVDTSLIRKVEGQRSGHAIIQVDNVGQNAVMVFGGTNRQVTREYIDEVLEHFEEGDMILLQNEIANIEYAVDRAYEKNMTVVLNPSPCNDGLKKIDMSKVSIFFMNEVEGKNLTTYIQPGDILIEMGERFPNSKCILTLGHQGAFYKDSTGSIYHPSIKCHAVDATAAGDVFEGYFIAEYVKNKDASKALKRASFAAGLSVCRPGASESTPTMDEVIDFIMSQASK